MKKELKIVLINPPSNCVDDDRIEPPLGLLYIVSMLRERGFKNIEVLDLSGNHDDYVIHNEINNIPKADVYGISCLSTTYNYVKLIINYLRKNYSESNIIIGGPHPTALPEESLIDLGADSVIVGEGELTFCDLLEQYISAKKKIKGVFQGNVLQNIDNYPFPARDVIDYNTYSRKLLNQSVVSIISSRGCSHHCIHCNSIVMGGGSNNVRYRSAENLIQEIVYLKESYNNFRFNDDNFTGHPEIAKILTHIEPLDIKFRIFARLEDLTENICKLLYKAGCIHVSVGLESLCPSNLKLLGKGSQIGKENNIRIAKNNGLFIRSSFMVGLPHDTETSINHYFSQAANIGIDEFAIYPLIPYPGTIIWKNPEKFGYKIIENDFSKYVQMGKQGLTCYALQHENFGTDKIQQFFQIATSLLIKGGAKHMSESSIAR